jgi:integron integrase
MTSKSPFLVSVQHKMRVMHYSIRTEKSFIYWIKDYIRFHKLCHPKDLTAKDIERFLTFLAVERKVSASTQNQALSALLFLYNKVLEIELPYLSDVTRASKLQRLPAVFTPQETMQVIGRLSSEYTLLVELMYGAGLRLMESVRLRVKDVNFDYSQIIVRSGKGNKDRVTLLPERVIPALRRQIEIASAVHESDLTAGFGAVYLPFALDRKYPNANKELAWQYVFPAKLRSMDPRSSVERRHHIGEQSVQRAVKKADELDDITVETMENKTVLDESSERLRSIQRALKQELERLSIEQRETFCYSLHHGKVVFEKSIRRLQCQQRVGVWRYLCEAPLFCMLSVPVIHGTIAPLVCQSYRHICSLFMASSLGAERIIWLSIGTVSVTRMPS